MLLLLIENQKSQVSDRCKNGRARTDNDASFAVSNPAPLRKALRDAKARMEHGDLLAKMRREPSEQLRREGNFRHEQNRALPFPQRLINEADIDGGFSAAGHAVKKRRPRLFCVHLQKKSVKYRLLLVI